MPSPPRAASGARARAVVLVGSHRLRSWPRGQSPAHCKREQLVGTVALEARPNQDSAFRTGHSACTSSRLHGVWALAPCRMQVRSSSPARAGPPYILRLTVKGNEAAIRSCGHRSVGSPLGAEPMVAHDLRQQAAKSTCSYRQHRQCGLTTSLGGGSTGTRLARAPELSSCRRRLGAFPGVSPHLKRWSCIRHVWRSSRPSAANRGTTQTVAFTPVVEAWSRQVFSTAQTCNRARSAAATGGFRPGSSIVFARPACLGTDSDGRACIAERRVLD